MRASNNIYGCVCERWLLEIIQSETERDLGGIWHLGKLVNLRLKCIPRKAGNISGGEQVGQRENLDVFLIAGRRELQMEDS